MKATSFGSIAWVALIWVVLFEINAAVFESVSVSPLVAWVFLPAAWRVLAVLVFRWHGVAGLALGAAITNLPLWSSEPLTAAVLSLTSALAPALAVNLGVRWWRLPDTLHGLQAAHLLAFAVLSALCSATVHAVVFLWIQPHLAGWSVLMPMSVGDFVGTLLVLYMAYAWMRWSNAQV